MRSCAFAPTTYWANMKIFLTSFYLLTAIFLVIYSYGFVDFNLTLSSHPLVINFVSFAQSLALFNRPLSIQVYLALISALFLAYLGVVTYWSNDKLKYFPWRPLIILAVLLALAYPFLSSDVFKYLFTGKIIALYHENPYLYSPDYFVGDLWLRFMRWVHTPTPYGPVMTALAVPYYYLGFGKFVPMLYLYKLDQVGWYLLAVWCIGKLSNTKTAIRNQLYFALNPLVLVEWLVNAHNDAIMISLLLAALHLLRGGRRALTNTTLLLSIGIKYVTVIALPLLFIKKKFNYSPSTMYYLLCTLAIAPLLYHYSTQYQPWYVTWLLPFAALSGSPFILWTTAAYSLGALLRYIPYIATGLWVGTPLQFALLTFVPPVLVGLVYNGIYALRSKTNKA